VNIVPLSLSGQTVSQLAGLNFHQFRFARIEFVLAGQHETQRLDAAVSKLNRSAGHFAIEVNIGSFDDTD